MSNTRPIDKSKKSNIKCEHCKYKKTIGRKGMILLPTTYCDKEKSDKCGQIVNYWERCKQFTWDETRTYIEVDDGT